jgi:hypothetical protein
MKKALILSLVMVTIMSLSAFATQTRTYTMGDNNNILLDDNNIWLYPSRINNYPNIAVGELSDGDFYNFGVNFKFNEKKPWVLGTYFSGNGTEYPYAYGSNYWGHSFGDQFSSLPSNRRVDLLYGRQLGSMNFGFGFTYVHSSQKSVDTTTVYWYDYAYRSANATPYEQRYSRYAFTLGLTPTDGSWDVAAYLSLGTWKEDWTAKNGYYETPTFNDTLTQHYSGKPDGYMDFALRARYFYKMNPTITLVPHADLMFGKHADKVTWDSTWVMHNGADTSLANINRGWKYSTKLTSFGAGCGMNYTPVTNVRAVLDFGFSVNHVKVDTTFNYGYAEVPITTYDTTWSKSHSWKENTTVLPYWKLGLEGDVFSWMVARFGVTSNWTNVTSMNTRGTKTNSANNETYLGLGFNWNRLHVDCQVDPALFTDGFYFISGRENTMNWQMSVLYDMF